MKSRMGFHPAPLWSMVIGVRTIWSDPVTVRNAPPRLNTNPFGPPGRRSPMPDGPTVRRRRLGAELRRLRDDHGMKLDEVATQLGLVASTLSRIETGKAPIRTR